MSVSMGFNKLYNEGKLVGKEYLLVKSQVPAGYGIFIVLSGNRDFKLFKRYFPLVWDAMTEPPYMHFFIGNNEFGDPCEYVKYHPRSPEGKRIVLATGIFAMDMAWVTFFFDEKHSTRKLYNNARKLVSTISKDMPIHELYDN